MLGPHLVVQMLLTLCVTFSNQLIDFVIYQKVCVFSLIAIFFNFVTAKIKVHVLKQQRVTQLAVLSQVLDIFEISLVET